MEGLGGVRCLLLACAVLASSAAGAGHPAQAQDARGADRRGGDGHAPGGHGPGEPRPAPPDRRPDRRPEWRPDRRDDHAAAGPRWGGQDRDRQDRDRDAWARNQRGEARPGQGWQDRREREGWRGPDQGYSAEGIDAPYAGVPLGYGAPDTPPFTPWAGDAVPDEGLPYGGIDVAPGYYGDPGDPAP